jgi:hypothetical protein
MTLDPSPCPACVDPLATKLLEHEGKLCERHERTRQNMARMVDRFRAMSPVQKLAVVAPLVAMVEAASPSGWVCVQCAEGLETKTIGRPFAPPCTCGRGPADFLLTRVGSA